MVIHFTNKVCAENGFLRSFHRRCLEVFRSYSWNGNVRELYSVVESHLIASDGDIVKEEDLDPKLFQKKENSNPRTLEEIDLHLDELKKQHVMDAIRDSASKAEAARKLGISPNRAALLHH